MRIKFAHTYYKESVYYSLSGLQTMNEYVIIVRKLKAIMNCFVGGLNEF
jgi:hypothetical protein